MWDEVFRCRVNAIGKNRRQDGEEAGENHGVGAGEM